MKVNTLLETISNDTEVRIFVKAKGEAVKCADVIPFKWVAYDKTNKVYHFVMLARIKQVYTLKDVLHKKVLRIWAYDKAIHLEVNE